MKDETLRNFEEMLNQIRDQFSITCGVPRRFLNILSNSEKHPTIKK